MNVNELITAAQTGDIFTYPAYIDTAAWAVPLGFVGFFIGIVFGIRLGMLHDRGNTPTRKQNVLHGAAIALGVVMLAGAIGAGVPIHENSKHARKAAVVNWLDTEYGVIISADEIHQMLPGSEDETVEDYTVLTEYDGELVLVGLTPVAGDRLIAVQYPDDGKATGVQLTRVN